jgi:hypothetical protein
VKWVLLVCGLLIGAIGTYAGMTYRQGQNPGIEDSQIIFAAKNFADAEQAGVHGFVSISGTLTGDRLAYPNNTYSIGCVHEQQIYAVSSIEQIGPKQIGRMDGPWWYPILKWDASEIVATDEPGLSAFLTKIEGAEFSFAELRGVSQQALEDSLQIARRA